MASAVFSSLVALVLLIGSLLMDLPAMGGLFEGVAGISALWGVLAQLAVPRKMRSVRTFCREM